MTKTSPQFLSFSCLFSDFHGRLKSMLYSWLYLSPPLNSWSDQPAWLTLWLVAVSDRARIAVMLVTPCIASLVIQQGEKNGRHE